MIVKDAAQNLTIVEVAELTGLSVKTVRKRIADRELRPVRHNPLLKRPRRILIPRREIEALIDRASAQSEVMAEA